MASVEGRVIDEDQAQDEDGPSLRIVEVDELFGRHTYRIRMGGEDASSSDRLTLLYGDNGCGKTTVLQMVWHLLSPARQSNHRTAIARVPFRRFAVQLSDGAKIEATKSDGLVGNYSIVVTNDGRQVCKVNYEVDENISIRASYEHSAAFDSALDSLLRAAEVAYGRDKSGRRKKKVEAVEEKPRPNDDRAYLDYVRSLGISPFFLADDRNIYSDDLVSESDRVVRPSIDRGVPTPEKMREAVARELSTCIGRVNEWLRQLTLGGQNQGSVGANSIYLEVVENLALEATNPIEEESMGVEERFRQVAERTKDFERLGLVPKLDSERFAALLPGLKGERRQIAEGVLIPYLSSLQARLDALQGAQTLIRTFLDQVNSFLDGKYVIFHPRLGLRIVDEDAVRVDPVMLSSGERQLMLLLCNTLLARRNSRLFIIDEPELSLNVKWQRHILEALLACTEGSDVQFIVATHSVEIITGHMENLAHLGAVDVG
ncbi:AAA family ATPase [Lentzea sp. BCCO 10_0856]|uniref:AAA family ATPase n=1 Tax=Lentzea miocenica TaxID=3095431 RepID=A0ABU4T8Y6_9PSEU|nr:AAA family ATPase [Lentzea sp. BCCO 10_0856]MDX8034634.1 AAA family ATPase [Lentzea sp. BCCO 10_0856]